MPPNSLSRLRADISARLTQLRGHRFGRAAMLIIAVAAVGYFLRNQILGTPVTVQEVVRGELVQTVVASGRVITPQRVSVGAVLTDWVKRIPVEEGQTVRSGDVLIELDSRDEQAAVAQAEAAVAQAEAKLRQLREVGLPAATESLVQAEANRKLASQQYERNVELKAKGFISDSALDDAKRNVDVAESQLKAARLQVATNSPAGSDFRMAETALTQARAALVAANARLEQTVIRAPADGILIGRNVEPGDVVQPGKELMALAPAGETQIVVQIDEKNLAQLRLGEKAIASADAYSHERFAAELFFINPGIDALRGSVEVKLRVPDPPSYLRQDMTVSVDIEVARRAGTLVAPAEAVFDAGGPQPWVLAAVDRRAVKKPVTLGLRGSGRVEILDGAVAGDVLIPATAGIAPGQRVRVAGTTGAIAR
jgi:HlyD family secretion protein